MTETTIDQFAKAKPYLLVWSGAGVGYAVVGPFPTPRAAEAWAKDPKNNPNDEPCWQTVVLTHTAPSIINPHESKAHTVLQELWLKPPPDNSIWRQAACPAKE